MLAFTESSRTAKPGLRAAAIAASLALALASCSKITPAVTAPDQEVKDDTVTISEVVSDGPGWMVIHSDTAGAPGPVIGYTAVAKGSNKNVVVKIDAYTATPTLYAMLHKDVGKVGSYEFPGPDVPVMLNGAMVSPAFKVTGLDPRVVVKDQQIQNGSVSIAEVLSSGPGWLVIHVDNKGSPGAVIGHAAVPDGLTKDLVVPITAAKATPVLYAMLHKDVGVVGTYEFPGPDVPVIVDEKMVSPGFKATK
jgi:hypothetical protein